MLSLLEKQESGVIIAKEKECLCSYNIEPILEMREMLQQKIEEIEYEKQRKKDLSEFLSSLKNQEGE